MIELTLEAPSVHAGQVLTAHVRWRGDRQPSRIIVAAQWETAGEGNRAWGVGRSVVIVPREGEHAAAMPVRLLIPHEGPVSFSGSLLSIIWKVKARVDQPGRDELAEIAFHVAPRPRSVSTTEPRS